MPADSLITGEGGAASVSELQQEAGDERRFCGFHEPQSNLRLAAPHDSSDGLGSVVNLFTSTLRGRVGVEAVDILTCGPTPMLQALIENEMAAGYEPPTDPATLAYALVHLRHAFLWNDATSGVRGDYERLREVQAALLGIPRGAPVARRTRRHEATGRRTRRD